MAKQRTFASLAWSSKGKVTRRGRFLTEMDQVIPWQRLPLKAGTIVDATIISAPSSTKNAAQARDPEMHQTRKGYQWYFGMKLPIGADPRGVVHRLTATDAATADITPVAGPAARRAAGPLWGSGPLERKIIGPAGARVAGGTG
jgi:IS5 family transposase